MNDEIEMQVLDPKPDGICGNPWQCLYPGVPHETCGSNYIIQKKPKDD